MKTILLALGITLIPYTHAFAQLAIDPAEMRPSSWERIALRVFNQTDDPIVTVRVLVPDAVQILGITPYPGWHFAIERATDATPQTITWTGDGVGQWEFQEFAFYGRLVPDVRQRELVFPTELTRRSGTIRRWSREDGSDAPPPVIQIAGTTTISNWGAFAVAAAALALSFLAIALAVTKGARSRA